MALYRQCRLVCGNGRWECWLFLSLIRFISPDGWLGWWQKQTATYQHIQYNAAIFFFLLTKQSQPHQRPSISNLLWVFVLTALTQKKPSTFHLKIYNLIFKKHVWWYFFFSIETIQKTDIHTTTINPSKKKSNFCNPDSRLHFFYCTERKRCYLAPFFSLWEKKKTKTRELKDDLTDVCFLCEVSCSPVRALAL